MKAIRVHEFGGPEALQLEEVPLPEPAAGEVRVRVEAAGVNFIDVYHRIGAYPSDPPVTIGREGAGVVDALGDGVTGVGEGERVAFAMVPGTYAEYVVVAAEKLAPLPSEISIEGGAAVMLQGTTAHYLTHAGANGQNARRSRHRDRLHARKGAVRPRCRRGRGHPLHRR